MEIFQDTDPLISFQYIELIHVLIGYDRITHALIQMITDDTVPFHGKLTALRHERHEIVGK